MRLSCSCAGNCHDNAAVESFFAALKNEMHWRASFVTRVDAKHVAIELIEADYNWRRFRSNIGHKVPTQVTKEFFECAKLESKVPLMAAQFLKLLFPKT